MLPYILRGISLAFSAGIVPGPFQTFLIGTTLSIGWRKAIFGIFAPLISDIPVIIVTTLVLRVVPPEVVRILEIAGGLFLFWIAYGAFQQWRQGASIGATSTNLSEATTRGQVLRRAVLMNTVNPAPWIFWSTVNGPLFVQGLSESVWYGVAFITAFYAPFLAMLALYVVAFDRLGRIDPRFTRLLLLLTVFILVVFGATLILQGVRG